MTRPKGSSREANEVRQREADVASAREAMKQAVTYAAERCLHDSWTWVDHGRRCPGCGEIMMDWGD